jgi:glucose/arabinose dehydrogenase
MIDRTGLFLRIKDLEVGPDGYLYVLTYTGSIYRITANSTASRR